jgi:hypothetical protein
MREMSGGEASIDFRKLFEPRTHPRQYPLTSKNSPPILRRVESNTLPKKIYLV